MATKITFGEFAKRVGVTSGAITQAITAGRIKPHSGKGRRQFLYLEEALADWEKNTDHTKRSATKKEVLVKVISEEPSLNDHRTKKEKFAADSAQLEYEQKAGKLINAEEAKNKWLGIVGVARTKMLGIPSKVRQRIPELTLEQVVVIEAIVRETLEDLADGDG